MAYMKRSFRHHHDPIKSFSAFLTERIPELETELHALLGSKEGIVDQIDAFISICNCPSTEHFAKARERGDAHRDWSAASADVP